MKKTPIEIGRFKIDHFYGGGFHPYFAVYEEATWSASAFYRKGAERC